MDQDVRRRNKKRKASMVFPEVNVWNPSANVWYLQDRQCYRAMAEYKNQRKSRCFSVIEYGTLADAANYAIKWKTNTVSEMQALFQNEPTKFSKTYHPPPLPTTPPPAREKGIRLLSSRGTWQASVQKNRVLVRKEFSYLKFGENALQMATNWRQEQLQKNSSSSNRQNQARETPLAKTKEKQVETKEEEKKNCPKKEEEFPVTNDHQVSQKQPPKQQQQQGDAGANSKIRALGRAKKRASRFNVSTRLE